MSMIDILENHFENVLKPKLKRLALIMNISKYIMGISIISFIFLIFGFFPYITGAITAIGFLYLILTSSYTKNNYKNQIVLPLMNLLDKSITFDYDKSGFKIQEIYKSHLFKLENLQNIKQSKFLEFNDQERIFKMCDIELEYHYNDNDSDNDIRTERGLFLIAPTDLNIKYETVVMPDIAERIMGDTGRLFQRKVHDSLKQIRLDSPDFEKKYIVYGNDEISTHYLLNHTVMEVFSDIETRFELPPYVSFTPGYICIFMPIGSGWLEPDIDIRKNMLESFDSVKKHFDMIFGLVEMIKKIEKHHLT